MAVIRFSPAIALLAAAPVAAQGIPVTVVATLASESGTPLPIVGRFWFVTANGRDSVPALTDGAGRARVNLAAGAYRLRSHQRVTLSGRAWYWDIPVAVERAMQIELDNGNAQNTPPAAAPTAVVMEAPEPARAVEPELPPHVPMSVSAARTDNPVRLKSGDPGYKDPGLAVLFGVLLAGGGHLYAGEIGKGLGIMAGAILGASLLVSQYCDGYYYGDCNSTAAGFGALIFLGSWVYSIADAAPAAGRANRKGPSFALRALPGGRTGVGLSLSLPPSR